MRDLNRCLVFDNSRQIRNAPTAAAAKKQNTKWKKKAPIDCDAWEKRGIDVMLKALRAKFEQNPELARQLVFSAPKRLIEVRGRGADRWSGDDGLLGKLLEQVRAELIANGVDVSDLHAAEEKRTADEQIEIERKRAKRAQKRANE